MLMKKIILTASIVIALIGVVRSQTISQELISSGGDRFSNASYQLDWSVGEFATETYSGSQGVLNQGFHQGVYDVSVSNQQANLMFNIKAYPNPTSDFISLDFSELQNLDQTRYSVTNLLGRELQTAEVLTDINQIDFSSFAKGTYFITVQQNNQIIKSFRIIKN